MVSILKSKHESSKLHPQLLDGSEQRQAESEELVEEKVKIIHHAFKPGAENGIYRDTNWSNMHLTVHEEPEFERKLPEKLQAELEEKKGSEVKSAADVKLLHAEVIAERKNEHQEKNDKIFKILEEI